MYKKKNLLNILICLESLDLYNNDKHNKYIYHYFNNLIKKHHQYKYLINLIQIINKSILKKNTQKTINDTLGESFSKTDNKNAKSLIKSQYINRFIYKYQFYYNIQKCDIVNQHKTQEIKKIAIINLYLIHKIVSEHNLFFLYTYIFKKIENKI